MRLRRKRIGFFDERFVDPAELPGDRRWVGVYGDPRELIYLPDNKEESAVFSNLIDKFQAKYPPNRLVALAMAIVAAPLAALGAWAATWVPLHLPGLPAFTGSQATAILISIVAGALLAAITAGYKFIDGWQRHEARKHQAEQLRIEREHELKMAIVKSDQPHLVLSALDELDGTGAKSAAAPEPAPDSPSATVSGVVPPPPPPPLAEVPHSHPPAAEAPPAPETLKEELDRVAPPPLSPGPPTSAPPSSPPRMTGFPPPSPAAPPPDPSGPAAEDANVIPAMPPPPPSTAPDPPIKG